METLYGKRADQGHVLNPRPPKDVYICDECIELFYDNVMKWRAIKPGLVPGPDHALGSEPVRIEFISKVPMRDPEG